MDVGVGTGVGFRLLLFVVVVTGSVEVIDSCAACV